MRYFFAILSLSVSVLFVSCRTEGVRFVPEIVYTVPTDAVMVFWNDRLEDVLEMAFDSTDVVRGFKWGKLSGHNAAVSFVFNRNLSPVICIDAGRSSEDTMGFVSGVQHQARKAGMQTRFFNGKDIGRSCNLLLLTRSEAVFSAVCRHVEAGRSIMDLGDFVDAFKLTNGAACQIVRNSSFEQILPRRYMEGCFKRAELLKFASHCADWTIVMRTEGRKIVRTVQHADESQFANVLPVLEAAESRLPEIMPEDTELAFSLPIGGGFRERYENWRYASSNLDKYEKSLAAVKKLRKVDPRKWEKQAGVREVALVQWGKGRKALAVRADKLPDQPVCSVNELEGVAAVLYGRAFASVRDSCCVRRGGWLICGSKPDVEAFPELRVCGEMPLWWPQKACKFVIRYHGRTMFADHNGIVIYE